VVPDDDEGGTLNEEGRVFTTSDPTLGIELQLVHDSREPPRWIEIWTRQRVYWIDTDRMCVAVFDRVTKAQDAVHPFLGGRLAGGEEQRHQGISLSNPVPLPGMKAVLQMTGGRYGRTSAIERVVLRVRMSNVEADDQDQGWHEITKRWAPLPQR